MSAPRPRRLVVVVGTATEIGKTWTTCQVIERLRHTGHTVAARKPAQSFDPSDAELVPPTDADLLAQASGVAAEQVCPPHRWYPRAMAPPMAADALGRPTIRVADLVDELAWPSGVDTGFVETAGGACSPIADDDDCAGFARRLQPDLALLVADAGLGTINSVRLSVGALAPLRTVVFLNRFDPADELHRRNRDWLQDRDGFAVHTDLATLSEVCAG